MRKGRRRLAFESLETRNLLTAVQAATDVVGTAGSLVSVPITVDDSAGMRAAEIRIEYDAAALEVRPQDVKAGSAWASKGMVMANVDEQAGVIVAFVFATESRVGGSGSLLDVAFTIRHDAHPSATRIDLAEVKLNEGAIPLAFAPIKGNDATDGLITITRVGGRRADSPRSDSPRSDSPRSDSPHADSTQPSAYHHAESLHVGPRRPDLPHPHGLNASWAAGPRRPATGSSHDAPRLNHGRAAAFATARPASHLRSVDTLVGPLPADVFTAKDDWLLDGSWRSTYM